MSEINKEPSGTAVSGTAIWKLDIISLKYGLNFDTRPLLLAYHINFLGRKTPKSYSSNKYEKELLQIQELPSEFYVPKKYRPKIEYNANGQKKSSIRVKLNVNIALCTIIVILMIMVLKLFHKLKGDYVI